MSENRLREALEAYISNLRVCGSKDQWEKGYDRAIGDVRRYLRELLAEPASPEPAVEALVAKWRARQEGGSPLSVCCCGTVCANELEAAIAAKGAKK